MAEHQAEMSPEGTWPLERTCIPPSNCQSIDNSLFPIQMVFSWKDNYKEGEFLHLQLRAAALCTLLPAHCCTPCDRCYLLSASSAVWRKLSPTTLSSPQVENGEGLDQKETKVEELRTGDTTTRNNNQHCYRVIVCNCHFLSISDRHIKLRNCITPIIFVKLIYGHFDIWLSQ